MTTRHPNPEAVESIDETMMWAAATLKVLVDQLAGGRRGAELTAVAGRLAGQVTTDRRAQILLLMFAHQLGDLQHAVDVLSCRHGEPVRVFEIARSYLEHQQGAALAEIAFDGS